MENRQEQIQENKAERVENRQQRRSDIAENHALRLEKRFGSYYTRLSAIVTKIQARIDASTTKNTTEAQSKLTEAKTRLEQAKVSADSAIAQFKAIDPTKWEEQKEKAKLARDEANKARQGFIDTLKLLNESVKLLKSAPVK